MFKPDKFIKKAAQIANNRPFRALDLARRGASVLPNQVERFSTSTPQFKDDTSKNGKKDTTPLIEKPNLPTAKNKLDNFPALSTNEKRGNSIQEIAAAAFSKAKQEQGSRLSSVDVASVDLIAKLAEQNPALKDTLKSFTEISKGTPAKTQLDEPTVQKPESQTSYSRKGNESTESRQVSPEKTKNTSGTNKPETKLYTARGQEIKLYHWKEANATRTIYSREQELKWLKNLEERFPELKGKLR